MSEEGCLLQISKDKGDFTISNRIFSFSSALKFIVPNYPAAGFGYQTYAYKFPVLIIPVSSFRFREFHFPLTSI